MSESRNQMISSLQKIVVPVLRDMKFKGSFPHYRRIREPVVDLITFQFSRWGGQFVAELGSGPSGGYTTHSGRHIPAAKLTAHDVHYKKRRRLGANPPQRTDHWFSFDGFESDIYDHTALDVVLMLKSQGEKIWTELGHESVG